MSRVRFRPSVTKSAVEDALEPLIAFFEDAADGRERFRWTLRDSLDEILDGQRTGRWCYQHLRKTEKTYLGTAIEINLTREFEIADGDHLDWRIADSEIDCKFSRDIGGWEIPMEMYICHDHGGQSADANHPAVLTWMNDDTNEWAAGVLRITDDALRWKKSGSGAAARAYNRDNKRRISDAALGQVAWLWGGIQTDLPPNLLLQLPEATRGNILRTDSSGQGRVNDLFRAVQDRLINRQVVLTVGQQDDAPKRARDARIRLRDEGIIVLGHAVPHQTIAKALGIDLPRKGSWISTRVAPVTDTDPSRRFFLDGQWWTKSDSEKEPSSAPVFPEKWDELRING
ncbi:restriction endonuclease [Rhodococcus sp. 05-2255-1e]|nr:restriction endonuclease [Rhodococcus sp. 05-2255-1e]